MTDLGLWLSRWYLAKDMRRGDPAEVRAAFAEAVRDDKALRQEARAWLAAHPPDVLKRDHISRVHKELLDGIA